MSDLEIALDESRNRAQFLNLVLPASLVLSSSERDLVRLRDDVYGSWQALIDDLAARREMNRRPYVHRLFVSCSADSVLASALAAYESRTGVNLSDYLSGE